MPFSRTEWIIITSIRDTGSGIKLRPPPERDGVHAPWGEEGGTDITFNTADWQTQEAVSGERWELVLCCNGL